MDHSPYTDAVVNIAAADNSYAIITRVLVAIRRSNRPALANEFIEEVPMNDYVAMIEVCKRYVHMANGEDDESSAE